MDPAELLAAYEQMAVIRRTEKAAHDLFLQGLVKGTTHLAAGHEAIAVGASAALRPDDYVFATYRGHHHAMARGATPEECLAELMSRATGLCRAKGGSMHLTKASTGMLGSYAIVGAHLPMAAGAAWSAGCAVRRRLTGDGATTAWPSACTDHARALEAGVGCLREQPVRDSAPPREEGCFQPCGLRSSPNRSRVGRGNSRAQRSNTSKRAAFARRARAGDGPALLEAQTYRHFGHSRADPATYRPAEEVERWLKHDPLDLARARLIEMGVPEAVVAEADERATSLVQKAVEAAKAGPAPDPREALTDVWADGGAAWRT